MCSVWTDNGMMDAEEEEVLLDKEDSIVTPALMVENGSRVIKQGNKSNSRLISKKTALPR